MAQKIIGQVKPESVGAGAAAETGAKKRAYDPALFQKRKEAEHKKQLETQEKCKRLLQILTQNNVEVEDDIKQWLMDGMVGKKRGPKSALVLKMFGTDFKAGMTCSLLDAFQKTVAGKPQIDRACEAFSYDKLRVKFVQKDPLVESYYEIVELTEAELKAEAEKKAKAKAKAEAEAAETEVVDGDDGEIIEFN